jgi:hypothetical protein
MNELLLGSNNSDFDARYERMSEEEPHDKISKIPWIID